MIRGNLIANYAAQAVVVLMSFAFVPVYIKLLGVEAYGVVGFFALLLAGLSVLDGGVSPVLNREVARSALEDDSFINAAGLVRSFELLGLGFFFSVSAVVFFASSWLANDWLNVVEVSSSSVQTSIVFMGCVVSLRVFEVIYKSVILGMQRQVVFSLCTMVLAVFRHAGAAAALFFYDDSLEVFFLWQVIVSLISVVVSFLLVYKAMPMFATGLKGDFCYLSRVRGFAGGAFFASVLAFFLGQLDKIFLSRALSLEDFSYYAVSVALAGVASLLVAPVSQAAYPYLVATPSLVCRGVIYRRFSQLVLVVLVPFSLVLSFFSQEILYAWVGNAVLAEKSWLILSLLVLGNLLSGFMVLPFVMEYVEGRAGLVVRFNVFALFFVFLALFFLVPLWGAVGGAFVWLVLNIIYFLGMGWVVNARVAGVDGAKSFFSDIFFSCLVGFVVVFFVRGLILPIVSGRWLSVVVAMIAWVAAVIAVSFILSAVRPYLLRVLGLVYLRVKR